MKPKLLAVLGTTSTGKTDLALLLAKKLNGELVSADSRQVYKYLDLGTAMVVLSFSVLVKVYPLIFLPYLLFLNFRKKKNYEFLFLLAIFLLTLSSYFLIYSAVFQISFTDSYVSYNFHNLKSVATESVWASVFYFAHLIQGTPLPLMESAYGINGILRTEVWPSINFYNYFWVLPVGVFNLYYFSRNFRGHHNLHNGEIDYKFVALNMLIFLIFYKVFSNQYWAWFLFLLPLISLKTLTSHGWIINIFLIILTTVLHTFVYPLNYSEWLGNLNGGEGNLFLVWVMVISSFILPILAARMFYDLFKKDSA